MTRLAMLVASYLNEAASRGPLAERDMKSDKIKLIVAIVIFAVAAVVIAYQLGLFSGGGAAKPAPVTTTDPNAKRGGPRAIPTK